jgi:hypothetical protein
MNSREPRRNRGVRVVPSACLSLHRPALDAMLSPKCSKCAESALKAFGIANAISLAGREPRTKCQLSTSWYQHLSKP